MVITRKDHIPVRKDNMRSIDNTLSEYFHEEWERSQEAREAYLSQRYPEAIGTVRAIANKRWHFIRKDSPYLFSQEAITPLKVTVDNDSNLENGSEPENTNINNDSNLENRTEPEKTNLTTTTGLTIEQKKIIQEIITTPVVTRQVILRFDGWVVKGRVFDQIEGHYLIGYQVKYESNTPQSIELFRQVFPNVFIPPHDFFCIERQDAKTVVLRETQGPHYFMQMPDLTEGGKYFVVDVLDAHFDQLGNGRALRQEFYHNIDHMRRISQGEVPYLTLEARGHGSIDESFRHTFFVRIDKSNYGELVLGDLEHVTLKTNEKWIKTRDILPGKLM